MGLGLGGGTLPTAFSQAQTGAKIDVVEIDPAVTRVARTYFPFGTNEQLRTHETDGRVFVKRAIKRGETYDLVVLDAFNSEYIPEHMLTREHLEEVKSVISPGGVLVANTFSHSALYDSESVTYKTVFGDFINVRVGNRLILWRDGGLPTRDEVLENPPPLQSDFQAFRLPRVLAGRSAVLGGRLENRRTSLSTSVAPGPAFKNYNRGSHRRYAALTETGS